MSKCYNGCINNEVPICVPCPVCKDPKSISMYDSAPELLSLAIRMQAELENVLKGNIQPGAIAFEVKEAEKIIAKASGGYND